MSIKVQSKVEVKRPDKQLDRQVSFQEWLWKVRNNHYAQHARVVHACEKIV